MNNVVQFWHIDSDTFLSDENLGRRVEDEWAAIPGPPVEYPTVDRLEPVVEVTKQLKELLYDEDNRKAVLDMVERVIPSLEKRRDYTGPGDDVRKVVNNLVEYLWLPLRPRRRSTPEWSQITLLFPPCIMRCKTSCTYHPRNYTHDLVT